jgi:hypothetical protein
MTVVCRGVEDNVGRALDLDKHSPHLKGLTYSKGNHNPLHQWTCTKGNHNPLHNPWTYNTTLHIDPLDVLHTQGLHPHPGPTEVKSIINNTIRHIDIEPWDSDNPGVNIDVNNVTCAKTHLQDIIDNKSHFMFLSEVSATPSVLKQIQHSVKAQGGHLVGEPLEPNGTTHNVGGVACKSAGAHRAATMTPLTSVFKDAVKSGRVGLFNVEIGGGHNMFVFIIYCFTGGHGNKVQAHKTNLIFEAICQERKAQPRGPTCICGDLNAECQDIPLLQTLLDNEGWVDLGAKAQIWGQPPGEHTCITSNAKLPTRRDYVFVDPDLFPMITNFTIDHDMIYPTHSTIRFRVSSRMVNHQKSILQRPLPLHDLLENHFQGTNDISTLTTTQINDLRLTHLHQFQLHLDQCMTTQARAFERAEVSRCAESHWRTWRETVEEAFLSFVQQDDMPVGWDKRAYQGHGTIRIKEVAVHGSPIVDRRKGTAAPSSTTPEVHRLRKQFTRCRQWADRVMVERRGALSAGQVITFRELNSKTCDAICANVDLNQHTYAGTFEIDLNSFLRNPSAPNTIGFAYSLRKHANLYEKSYHKLVQVGAANTNKARATQASQDTNLSHAYKQLRTSTAPPLQYTTTTTVEDGVTKTHYVTIPREVDKVVRQAWASIREGQAANETSIVASFMDKYADYICEQPEHICPDLSGTDIFDIASKLEASSGGLDGFLPEDFKLLTPLACEHLAKLLTMIEAGAQWPEDLSQARAAFLPKDEHDLDDCLKYRVLMILPT